MYAAGGKTGEPKKGLQNVKPVYRNTITVPVGMQVWNETGKGRKRSERNGGKQGYAPNAAGHGTWRGI